MNRHQRRAAGALSKNSLNQVGESLKLLQQLSNSDTLDEIKRGLRVLTAKLLDLETEIGKIQGAIDQQEVLPELLAELLGKSKEDVVAAQTRLLVKKAKV